MPWQAEDWDGLHPVPATAGTPRSAEELAWSILGRLPGCESLALGDVGGGLSRLHPERLDDFARVSVIDAGGAGPETFDVVAALGTLAPRSVADLDERLRTLHGRLVEGGVLLVTVPAASWVDGPAEIRLGRQACQGAPRFHEVELQYRLQRAGFQGVRLRRVAGAGAGCAQIVAMAVRRAHN